MSAKRGRALTKSDWKRLESFHLRCQRRILGIKWSDFTTNAEVYTRSGLQSIQSIIRLSLFGHVARMPDNTGQSSSARGMRRPRWSSTLPKLAQITGPSSYHLAAPDLFRLWLVRWRRPQLRSGSGRVENVRYTASSALRWRRRRHFVLKIWHLLATIFTALHHPLNADAVYDEKAVRLSFCPSVCLFVKRVDLDKTEERSVHFYIIRKII